MTQAFAEDLRALHPDRVIPAGAPPSSRHQTSGDDLIAKIEDFARNHPLSFGLYALGVGFVLGWKLKPW